MNENIELNSNKEEYAKEVLNGYKKIVLAYKTNGDQIRKKIEEKLQISIK